MPDQRWWVQTSEGVLGPMPTSALRALAAGRKIGPETFVSPDTQDARWVRAGKLKGLFAPPPEATAEARLQAKARAYSIAGDREPAPPPPLPQAREQAPVQSADPGQRADKPTLGYPILRVRRRRFGRTHVVAIYESHLLLGRRFWSRPAISEEMCHPAGEPALRALFKRVNQIERDDVDEVREETAAPPRSGRRQVGSCHFMVRSPTGQCIRFSVPAAQANVPRAALSLMGQNGYWIRPTSRWAGPLALAVLAVGFIIPVFASILWPDLLGLWAVVAVGFLGAAWAVYRFFPRARWSPIGEYGSQLLPPEFRRKPASRRSPIRSKGLGWTLKLLGIAGWLVIASPLSDGFSKYVKGGEQYAWKLIWAPVTLLIYAGYRLSQLRYEPSQPGDVRKPVLFLRPFEDDGTTSLQPLGLLAGLCGLRADVAAEYNGFAAPDDGRVADGSFLFNAHPVRLLRMIANFGTDTSEESLVRFFEAHGPVIAIGRPGETLAAPGAARMYVSDDQWQQAILTELKRAQAVVLQPGSSEGVRWEFEQIRAHVEPWRVLLCLVSFWQNPEGYERLSHLVAETLGLELPRVVPFLKRPAFVYFDRSWKPRLQELSYKCPALWPVTGDASDLKYSLQSFLRGMHGGESELPRPVRWARGGGTLAASFGAVALSLVVAVAPDWVIHVIWPEVPIPTLVAQSENVTLHGRAVPYHLKVPGALVDAAELLDPLSRPNFELVRASRDRRLLIQIQAIGRQEDLSALNLKTERLKAWSGQSVLESSEESVRHAGADWVQSRIVMNMRDVGAVTEITRATSDSRGTVMIIVQVCKLQPADAIYQRIAEEVFESFQFDTEPAAAASTVARRDAGVVKMKEHLHPDVAGVWECDGVNFASHFTWVFHPNGRINGPNSRMSWRFEGDKMVITNLPWVDTCTFAEDGESFTAVNQEGGIYEAKRIARP